MFIRDNGSSSEGDIGFYNELDVSETQAVRIAGPSPHSERFWVKPAGNRGVCYQTCPDTLSSLPRSVIRPWMPRHL